MQDSWKILNIMSLSYKYTILTSKLKTDKFCNIPGDQLQLTKTPVAFMDLDDAFHICQARICSYLISLLWAEVKSFATY